MEVLTAFVDENDRQINHELSRELLLNYAPDPVPEELQNFVLLAGQLIQMLDISVRAQAAFASAAQNKTVSVSDILASLGWAIDERI
jgi:hypothetical protein